MSTDLDHARQANADLWRQIHHLEEQLQTTEAQLTQATATMFQHALEIGSLEDHIDACATGGCELCKRWVAESAATTVAYE